MTTVVLPALLVRLGQADGAVCVPLVQGADMASPAEADAFFWRQVTNCAESFRVLVHAVS